MDPQQIRLECLRLAAAYYGGGMHDDAVRAANDFFVFVIEGGADQEDRLRKARAALDPELFHGDHTDRDPAKAMALLNRDG